MLGRGGLRSAVLRGVAIRPPCSVVATLLLQRGSRSGHSGVLRIHVCYCKDRGSGPTFHTGDSRSGHNGRLYSYASPLATSKR